MMSTRKMEKRSFCEWQGLYCEDVFMLFFMKWPYECKKESHDFKSAGIFKENQLGN